MSGSPSTLKNAARGFSVSLVLRVARLAANLVLTSLLARYLGQEGFGQLAVAMAIVMVLSCLTELGMQTIVTRDLVDDSEAQWTTLGSAFISRLVVSLVAYAGLALYVWIAQPAHGTTLLVYGAVLVVGAASVLMVWLVAKQGSEALSWAQFLGFMGSAIVFGAGILLKAPVWYFAMVFVVECILTLLIVLFHFKKRGGSLHTWRWSGPRTRKLLGESWYELASQLALLMLFKVDTIMIEAMRGTSDAGVYGAAVRVSEAVYFIPTLLASFSFPPLVALRERDPARYRQRFTEYFSITLLITVPCAVFIVLVAPHVVGILFGKDFTSSAPILAIHAWALIPFAIGTARNCYLTAESKLWLNLPCIAAALGLNILLNWLWIPTCGGLGAAWATLISYTVGWVVTPFLFPQSMDLARIMVRSLTGIPALITRTLRGKFLHASSVKSGD